MLLTFLITTIAFGEEAPQNLSLLDALAKKYQLSIRQSELDKNNIEKPALLQFVHPSDSSKDDSYLVDIGITYKWKDTAEWLVGPTAEYHRHTETSKEQDNIQAGLKGIYIYGDITKELTMYTQASLKYKKDRIVTGEGMLAKLDIAPLKTDWGLGSDIGPKEAKFLWEPTIGIQYETASDVLKTGQSGEVVRTFSNLEVGFFPYATSLRRNLQLIVRDSYWYNINRAGGYSSAYKKDHNLFQTGVTIYFDESQHFGLGVDFFNGENPEQGLLKQKATMVTLKAKF
jgi:hypothetical protein